MPGKVLAVHEIFPCKDLKGSKICITVSFYICKTTLDSPFCSFHMTFSFDNSEIQRANRFSPLGNYLDSKRLIDLDLQSRLPAASNVDLRNLTISNVPLPVALRLSKAEAR
ncbi:hypothetical protein Nepgr_021196 [Nepenthes gracilis]|uniref:Uncharacterized protein n=1 Tax=Nepenthes gracilis TaxID=150966 RepID=A0AAD3SWT9_NEPGR|nr:hypothetical protein Nepgr_021196 [Nepenthes gracilis]